MSCFPGAHRCVSTACLLVALLCLTGAQAQDEKPAQSPAEAFATATADWEQLGKEVEEIRGKFRTALPDDREVLKKRYEELIGGAQKKLTTLRQTALAAYTAAPNKDEAVTRTLIRMIANDVGSDDYEAAMQVVKLLVDNKSPNNELYNYAGLAAFGMDNFKQADEWLQKAADAGSLTGPGQQAAADAAKAAERFADEAKVRAAEKQADDLPRVKMETNRGVMVIELYENEAPETVGNFVSLVESGFYDGLTFHRVIGNFMAQGGDPKGTGSGGPGYEIYCECTKKDRREHFRGTLSMAHAGQNTGGSQFFLTFRTTPFLDGKHTAFGRVIEGLDVLAKIQRREPGSPTPSDKIVKAEVIRKRDHKYEPHKVE